MRKIIISLIFIFIATSQTKSQVGNNQSSEQKTDKPVVEAMYNGEEDAPFTKTEIMAEFSGGEKAWNKHLKNNLNSGVLNNDLIPKGKYSVVIRFIVAKDGTISNVVAETNYGFGMEEEAIRIIKIVPKWSPAIQNGNIVRAYKRQSITFIVK